MTLVRAVIRLLALPLLVASLGAVLASAGATLGYDFQAYVQAARRLLDGAPLYDRSVDLAGGFAIYLYPPPFALAFVPFALLPEMVGTWVWTALLVGCLLGAVALLPVRREIRWLVLLLAAVDWPVLYGVSSGRWGHCSCCSSRSAGGGWIGIAPWVRRRRPAPSSRFSPGCCSAGHG